MKKNWKKKVARPIKKFFTQITGGRKLQGEPPSIYNLVKDAIKFSEEHPGIPVTLTFGEKSFSIYKYTDINKITKDAEAAFRLMSSPEPEE
jgi:hypothetical protein